MNIEQTFDEYGTDFHADRTDFRESLPSTAPREGHTEKAAMEVARKTTLRATNTAPHTSRCRGWKALPSPWIGKGEGALGEVVVVADVGEVLVAVEVIVAVTAKSSKSSKSCPKAREVRLQMTLDRKRAA